MFINDWKDAPEDIEWTVEESIVSALIVSYVKRRHGSMINGTTLHFAVSYNKSTISRGEWSGDLKLPRAEGSWMG